MASNLGVIADNDVFEFSKISNRNIVTTNYILKDGSRRDATVFSAYDIDLTHIFGLD